MRYFRGNIGEVMRRIQECPPTCILVESELQADTALMLSVWLRATHPQIRIIMSLEADPACLLPSLRADVSGYLSLDYNETELQCCLESIGRGLRYFSPVLERILNLPGDDFCPLVARRLACLSGREKEVLRLMRRGLIAKEIAAQLRISEHTVNDYKKSIVQRLELGSRREILSFMEPYWRLIET